MSTESTPTTDPNTNRAPSALPAVPCSADFEHRLKRSEDARKALSAAVDHLQKQVDELSEDKKRLDWIERYKGRCGYAEETYLGEGFFAHPLAMGDKYDAGKTIREAIDEARKIF